MSHFEITTLFNAYDLQKDPYEVDKICAQEVVDYCEARFRAALQTMLVVTEVDLPWMTFLLFRELELCFSYIGVAAAIGRSINIPIIVRSLGHDLYRFGLTPDTSFRASPELLAYVDGSLSSYGLDDPNLRVVDFHLPWWKPRTRPKKIKHDVYLSFSTVESALAIHRTHLSNPDITGSTPRPLDLSPELNKPAYSWHPEVNARLDHQCTRCRLYRAVSLGIVDKLRDVENRIHGLEIANQGERDIGMRRASGFNALYETVFNKEIVMESASGPGEGKGSGSFFDAKGKMKAKKVSTLAERIRLQAEERWRDSTPSRPAADPRSKWTWGVEMDSQDIWEMARGADMNFELPHSGYDMDLPTGDLRTSSPIPGPDDIKINPDDRFDRLAPDFPYIRYLRPEEFPIAFSLPMLHYRAAGETESGSDSESGFVDRAEAKRKFAKQLTQDEASGPKEPFSVDSSSVIIKRNPPNRPWLVPPPPGYVRPPQAELGPGSNTIQADEVMDIADNESDVEMNLILVAPDNEERPRSLGSEITGGDFGLVAPDSSDEDLPIGTYGLVEPDLQDNSGYEIPVRNVGLIEPDLDDIVEEGPHGNYGLVAPDSPDEIEEDFPFGLVAPDVVDDIEEEISVEMPGLDLGDTDMRIALDNEIEGSDGEARTRVRIRLPVVNPATGQYCADSFSDVPDDWFD